MKEPREKITVSLKKGFGASVAIDGFGTLRFGEPREVAVAPRVARHFRASTMYAVVPPAPDKPAARKTKKGDS